MTMVNWKSVTLFYRERYIFSFFNLSLLFLLISLGLIIVGYQPQEDLAILHYNIFYGIDYLGPWFMPYINIGLLFIALLINFVFSYRIFTKDKYMSYYLNFAGTVAAILFTLYIYLLTPYT